MAEDDVTSVFLEFKPVGNLHWIVNKASTFSFEQMSATDETNRFQFIPVQNCQNSWSANINSDYTLKTSAITKCQYTNNNDEVVDVEPRAVKLIAQPLGYGGVVVTLGEQAVINLTSAPQNLKGIFLIHSDTRAVVSYCILPEPVKVHNYLQLNYNSPIIEITPTVYTQI